MSWLESVPKSVWLEWVQSEHLPSARGGAPKLSERERELRDDIVCEAVALYHQAQLRRRWEWLQDGSGTAYMAFRDYYGASASDVAAMLRVAPARRLGHGAVKGSWSGSMPAALRVQGILRSLASRGRLESSTSDYRLYYTPAGRPWWRARDEAEELDGTS